MAWQTDDAMRLGKVGEDSARRDALAGLGYLQCGERGGDDEGLRDDRREREAGRHLNRIDGGEVGSVAERTAVVGEAALIEVRDNHLIALE